MGLRSRQRRLAGVKHEDSFDVETSKHRSATLQGLERPRCPLSFRRPKLT
jgi:hypothetical protein